MELEIIAHRGDTTRAPENTPLAFEMAINGGADSIEFDLQLSADGVPIIFHDQTLDRTTGSPEKIREKTWQDLQQIEISSRFYPSLKSQKIPSLEASLTLLKKVKKFLYFDVKVYEEWSTKDIENLAEILDKYQLQSQGIITSFNQQFIDKIKAITPEFQQGSIVGKKEDYLEQLEKAVKTGNRFLSSEYHILLENPELIRRSQEQGIDLVVWTVDDPEDLKRLIDIGLTRIVTNSLIQFIKTLNHPSQVDPSTEI